MYIHISATVPPARRACGANSVSLLDLHPLAGNPSGIPDFLLDLHPLAGNLPDFLLDLHLRLEILPEIRLRLSENLTDSKRTD